MSIIVSSSPIRHRKKNLLTVTHDETLPRKFVFVDLFAVDSFKEYLQAGLSDPRESPHAALQLQSSDTVGQAQHHT
jgi:hypothetical protein